MTGMFTPACARCEWTGTPTDDQRVAFRRATAHIVDEHQHRPYPDPDTEAYPEGWDGEDVPTHMTATCAVCSLPIDWDPRNLWSHSA